MKHHYLKSLILTASAILISSNSFAQFSEHFDTNDAFSKWTVIDANNDGQTWTYSEVQNAARSGMSRTNTADDWLISPDIELEGGYTYQLSFRAKNQRATRTEELLQVKYGTGTESEDMETSIFDRLTIPTDSVFSAQITITASGSYNFGFHQISKANQYRIYVDDVEIKKLFSNTAPDSVTNIRLTADATGKLTTNIVFTTPNKTLAGDKLTSISRVEVYRDSTLAKTVENPVVGGIVMLLDSVPTAGEHTYTFKPFAGNEEGRSNSASVYVGSDRPQMPENFVAIDNGSSVHLQWSPVSTIGVNGGNVFPELTKYTIYAVEDGHLGNPIDTISGTSYDIALNTATGEQDIKQWAVMALNAAGISEGAVASIITGEPYALPFRESFEKGHTHNFWSVNRSSALMYMDIDLDNSYDDDNGSFDMDPMIRNNYGTLASGKVSVKGAKNPELVFYYHCHTKVEGILHVYVKGKNQDMVELDSVYYQNLSGDDAWHQYKASLANFAEDDYLSFRIQLVARGPRCRTMLDDIQIRDVLDNDLNATLELPDSATIGKQTTATIKVENVGQNEASNYKVILYCNDKELASENSSENLSSFGYKKHTLSFHIPSNISEDSLLTMKAVVEYDSDNDINNNTATGKLKVEKAQVPPVENLTLNDGKLSWTSPAAAPVRTKETFESYGDWATSFVDWTLVDANKAFASDIYNCKYGNVGEAFAFEIYSPFAVSQTFNQLYPDYDAHTGKKFAAAPLEDDGNGNPVAADNWLISPELYGGLQRISLYVHNINTVMPENKYPESFDVLYSKNSTATSDFVKIDTTIVAASGEWQKIEFNVPDGSKYFAIHHITPAGVGAMLSIDDITYLVSSGLPVSYNIYRDGELVNNTASTTYQTDASSTHRYDVTAVYADGSESSPKSIGTTNGITSVRTTINDISSSTYNLSGQRVNSRYKGIVIKNGKKYISNKF